jgi:triosephosphate isomerase (TIM)
MAKIIVANWKMNPQSLKEAGFIFKELSSLLKNIKHTQIVICPPFPYLFVAQNFKNKNIFLGAQNVAKDGEGAHTGEVSSKILKNMGVSYVIVGHSERRFLGEDNITINEKILNLIKNKITPILCVGENKRDHDGFYLSFVKEQIKNCLSGIPKTQIKNIIIAYEPVWAIGKGAIREATKEEFLEMKIFIKKVISDIYDVKTAHNVLVIYGGSVNPLNAELFIKGGEADGLLVGRDSLNPKKFEMIIKNTN